MTVHEKFVEDMDAAGIVTAAYSGRFFWDGPAARSDQQNGPTLQDIIKRTAVPLQWDSLGSNCIVYPIGKAKAGWRDAGTGLKVFGNCRISSSARCSFRLDRCSVSRWA